MDTSLSMQVLELLHQTFICTLDTQRQAVEQQLQALSSDWPAFLQTLLTVITSRHQEVTQDLKISAASFVLMKARQSEKLGTQMVVVTAGLVFAALGEAEGHPASLLTEALEQLLQTQDEEQSLACDFFPKLETQLSTKPETSLRLFRSLFSTVGGSMLPFVYRTADLLIGLSSAWQQTPHPLKLFAEWSRVAEQLVKYVVAEDEATACSLANNEGFVTTLGKMLGYSQRGSDLMLVCSDAGEDARECVLFVLKSIAALFQCILDNKQAELERLHNTKFTSISGFAAPEVPITQLVGTLLAPLLQNLLSFCVLSDVQSRMEQETVSDEVVEVLSLMVKACSDSLYNGFFLKTFETMVMFLCPALMMRTRKETEDFADNPEEYVALALDVCDSRESMTPKTCAAQLLDILCTTVDGALTFSASFLIQMIDFTVTGSREESLPHYRSLSHPQAAAFLRALDEDRIDVALLSLCVLADGLLQRKDLKTLAGMCVKTHFATMARSQSDIIKTRLVLLCVKFARAFEPEEATTVANMLEFLVFCLNPETASPALLIQASEGLSELMRTPHVFILLEPLLPKLLEMCLAVAAVQTEKSFFEALEEMVKASASSLYAQLPSLLDTLVQKIRCEHERDPRGMSPGSILALKCWNILQIIADCPSFVPEHLSIIEQAIWPLMQLLGSAKLHFEDCICSMLGCLIHRSMTVTDMDWKLFEAFPVVQALSGGGLGSLFFVVNQFIVYAAEAIRRDTARGLAFFSMGISALGAAKGEKINEEERAQGALLLQVLITTYPGLFDSEYARLFLALFEKATFATKGYFRAKIAETLLCAVACNPLYSVSVLKSLHYGNGSGLGFTVKMVVEACQWFKFPYDRKIAVLGLRSWAQMDGLPEEMRDAMPQFFLNIFGILNNASEEKCKKKKKKHKKADGMALEVKGTSVRIKISKNVEKCEERRIQKSVKQLITPINDIDEIQYFRETLDWIRVKNTDLFTALIGRLGPEQRLILVALLQAKKVGEAEAIRKVVKTKRPQASS